MPKKKATEITIQNGSQVDVEFTCPYCGFKNEDALDLHEVHDYVCFECNKTMSVDLTQQLQIK